MKILAAAVWTESYRELAKLTILGNKEAYCHRHGYGRHFMQGGDRTDGHGYSMLHIQTVLDALRDGLGEWVWMTPVDGIVTNMSARVEDLIARVFLERTNLGLPELHLMISCDANYLNDSTIIARKHPWTITYFEMILEKLQAEPYRSHPWQECVVIWDTLAAHFQHMFVAPQRWFNSYDYGLYPGVSNVDRYGLDGQWRRGDFCVHWPGRTLEQRIAHYHEYAREVVG